MDASVDASAQVSTTSGNGRSRTVRAAVIAGALLLGALVAGGVAYAAADGPAGAPGPALVDQGGSGGFGVHPAQGGSGSGCPLESGPAPEASSTQL